MRDNKELLRAALVIALADDDFLGNNTKVDKALDALTPKSTVSAVLKRLQGNALRDYSVNKENGVEGYNASTKALKIKEYVYDRFKSYMSASKTSVEATKLFNAAYPEAASTPADPGQAESFRGDEAEAA